MKKHIRLVSLLLAIIIFFQSCSVYQSKTASIEEAVQFEHKIKLVINAYETYEFKELQKENGNIYGIARKNSDTAKYLHKQIVEETKNDKYVKILLTNDQLNKLHLQNKPLSTLISIALPTIFAIAIYIIAMDSINIDLSGLTF